MIYRSSMDVGVSNDRFISFNHTYLAYNGYNIMQHLLLGGRRLIRAAYVLDIDTADTDCYPLNNRTQC